MSLSKSLRGLIGRSQKFDAYFRRLVWSRVHFPEWEMRKLSDLKGRPMSVAIDVGAALGAFAWILNRKARRVIAFEPGEVHQTFIRKALSGTNIELIDAAVGEGAAEVTLYTPGDDVHALHSATVSESNPVAHGTNVHKRIVKQISLDDFVRPTLKPDERVDFIKIDVEGYENGVFKGAAKIIGRDYPAVLCEIEERHNPEYMEVFEFMANFGYRSFVLRKDRFEPFDGAALSNHQSPEALEVRLRPGHVPRENEYFNNILFEHSKSRIKLTAAGK